MISTLLFIEHQIFVTFANNNHYKLSAPLGIMMQDCLKSIPMNIWTTSLYVQLHLGSLYP